MYDLFKAVKSLQFSRLFDIVMIRMWLCLNSFSFQNERDSCDIFQLFRVIFLKDDIILCFD